MPDDNDKKTRREQAEASQRLQDIGMGISPESGGEATPGGQRVTGSGGFASGLQPGGTKPGGGPGAGPGSIGTGGAS